MTQRTATRLKALILILMAIFFAEKFASGKLYYYIGPRFAWLAIVAVALLILLAGAYNLIGKGKEDHHHDHADHDHHYDPSSERASIWPLVVVALPLALGVIVPAQPLGASAVSTRGISTDVAAAGGSENRLTIVPAERNVLDWVRALNATTDPAGLNGQEADVVGFVYRDPRFADDQFMVGRFTLTCCVADALAIGLVVKSDQSARLQQDTWVRVKGSFLAGDLDGQKMPVLIADEITPVQEPEQPYLYP
jgi:putative membrane protein